jgi:hypothetical protein
MTSSSTFGCSGMQACASSSLECILIFQGTQRVIGNTHSSTS